MSINCSSAAAEKSSGERRGERAARRPPLAASGAARPSMHRRQVQMGEIGGRQKGEVDWKEMEKMQKI
uniref:Uncharacterized protein n=1 Tax=Ditylenchus dipsaci TaxID=166011 RepID=A0A915E8K1_9BILA